MAVRVATVAFEGVEARPVDVQVQISSGSVVFNVVGLGDKAVAESRERVRAALIASGLALPAKRITVNLAPADMPKEGSHYDLPIALGILAATKQLNAENLGDWLIAGELSLSGATRPVRGALAMARLARSLGKRGVLLPGISAEEAAMVEGVAVYRVDSLDRAVRFLSGEFPLHPLDAVAARHGPRRTTTDRDNAGYADFSEIKGQHALRRAVEVAVCGFHNLLMLSDISPGTALRGTRQTDRTTCFRIPVMKSGV